MLISKLDGRRLVVALVPVCRELDLKALAGLAGAGRAAMASRSEAERSTGYALGAISPLGQRKRLPICIDASAALLPKVYVSAGRRGLELGLAPLELVEVCGARMGDIAR